MKNGWYFCDLRFPQFSQVILCLSLHAHPSAVLALVNLVVENLLGRHSSSFALHKFSMKKTTRIAKSTQTVGATAPLGCFSCPTSVTFVHRLVHDFRHIVNLVKLVSGQINSASGACRHAQLHENRLAELLVMGGLH